MVSQNALAGGTPSRRWAQRYTVMQETTTLNTMNPVRAQVRSRPTLLGIFRIHLAIRGYRSLIHRIPSSPQNTE